jgi:hypothetical protein
MIERIKPYAKGHRTYLSIPPINVRPIRQINPIATQHTKVQKT